LPTFNESPRASKKPIRLLKNAHLRRCPHPSSLRRTSKYASLLRISGALHLPACRSFGVGRGFFEQPEKNYFFSSLLEHSLLRKIVSSLKNLGDGGGK